ncbi:MAG: hypothetical protein ACJ77K_19855 [Bacteroidia bacterium]
MKKLLIAFLFLSVSCFSQEKYKLLHKIDVDADQFTTDNQCNVYVVKNNELIKYDKTGKLLYKYSNKTLGKISYVDASNMLRVLVFYKDFSSVIFLDNTLTQNGEPVDLRLLDISAAPVVCSSYDNGIWVYDPSRWALIRYDKTFADIIENSNLEQSLNDSLLPNLLVEYNNKIYLNNPRSGIIVFDNYGTYYKTLPLKNLQHFQPITDWVYYAEGKKIKAYNIKTTEEKEFDAPSDFKTFRLEDNILLLQDAHSIMLYSAP